MYFNCTRMSSRVHRDKVPVEEKGCLTERRARSLRNSWSEIYRKIVINVNPIVVPWRRPWREFRLLFLAYVPTKINQLFRCVSVRPYRIDAFENLTCSMTDRKKPFERKNVLCPINVDFLKSFFSRVQIRPNHGFSLWWQLILIFYIIRFSNICLKRNTLITDNEKYNYRAPDTHGKDTTIRISRERPPFFCRSIRSCVTIERFVGIKTNDLSVKTLSLLLPMDRT